MFLPTVQFEPINAPPANEVGSVWNIRLPMTGTCVALNDQNKCVYEWYYDENSIYDSLGWGGKWVWPYDTPDYVWDAYDVYPTITLNEDNTLNLKYYFIYEYSPWNGYEVSYDYSSGLRYKVYVNDREVHYYDRLIKEEENNEVQYLDEIHNQKNNISFNYMQENIYLSFLSGGWGMVTREDDIPGVLGDYKAYYEMEEFVYYTSEHYSPAKVNFETYGQEITVKIPVAKYYEILNGTTAELKYENITLKNLVPSSDIYPYEFSEIISLSYVDELNNLVPSTLDPVKIYVDLKGFEEGFYLNATWSKDESKNNTWVLTINDSMYYDEAEKLMKRGSSNVYQTFTDMFVFPFDYPNNYGTLTFVFSPSLYTNKDIEVVIPIGTKYSYRGTENSKYRFIEVDDLSIEEEETYTLMIPTSDFKLSINEGDIYRWLSYE